MAEKLKLSAGEESALSQWCGLRVDELDHSVLNSYREKWDQMIQAFKLLRRTNLKTFPWKGASNIVSPDTLRAVVTVSSQLYSAVWGAATPFIVRSYTGGKREVARALETFIDFYSKVAQGQEDFWRDELPYWALLGTTITKLSFVGGASPWPEVRIESVPLNNFYIYPREKDIARCSFCGEAMYVHVRDLPADISDEKRKSLYSYAYGMGSADRLVTESEKTGSPEIAPGFIILHDLYMTYDFSQKGEDFREIRVVFHRDSSIVLFVEEVAGEDRPYVPIFYRPDKDAFFGLGIGDAVLYLQEGVDTAINQTLDNNTVSNAKGFIRAREAGIDDELEIFPGFVWTARDPKAVQAVSLGDVNPGAFRSISMMRELLMSGAMVGENASGMDSTITRSRQTFGGQALNVAVSSRIQSFNAAGYYRGLEEVMWRTLEMLRRYSPDVNWEPYVSGYLEDMGYKETQLVPEWPSKETAEGAVADLGEMESAAAEGQEVGAEPGTLDYAFQARLSPEEAALLRDNVFLSDVVTNRRLYAINASKKNENKQIERQATMILSQIVNAYLKQVIEFSMQIAQLKQQPGTEELVATLTEAWRAANSMLRQVLSTYTSGEVEDLIIDLEEVQSAVGNRPDLGGVGGVAPQAGGAVEGAGAPGPGGGQGPVGPGMLGGLQGFQGGMGVSPGALQEPPAGE